MSKLRWQPDFYPSDWTKEQREDYQERCKQEYILNNILYSDDPKEEEDVLWVIGRDFPIRVWLSGDGLTSWPEVEETKDKGVTWSSVQDKELIIQALNDTVFHLCRLLSAHGCNKIFDCKPCIPLHNLSLGLP